MIVRFRLNSIEAARFAELLQAMQQAERAVVVAFTMIAANHDYDKADFKGFDGTEIEAEVPSPFVADVSEDGG